jgi:hypothetical protein
MRCEATQCNPACRYSLPRQLREHKLLCKDAQKPLVLLTLLARRLAGQQTLVFAASVETAHRWDAAKLPYVL